MRLNSFLALYGLFFYVVAFEQDLTVEVRPGRMECFFQEIKKTGGVEIEYQVEKLFNRALRTTSVSYYLRTFYRDFISHVDKNPQ